MQKTNARLPKGKTSALDSVNINTQLIARRADGELIVDSLTIAREFDREHKNVLRTLDSLIDDGTVDLLNFEPTSYTDEMNRPQRAIRLTERGALIAMPFIGGRRAREGQVRLVSAFMALRERATTTPLDLTDPSTLLALLQTHASQSLQLQQQVTELEPKAQALDRLSAADGSLCITDAAKSLKVQPKVLFGWLARHHWIYRRGVAWTAHQDALDRGVMEHRVTTIHRDNGNDKATTQARVTAKGLALLAKKLAEAAR
jgi:Rha family phage regulatory protein